MNSIVSKLMSLERRPIDLIDNKTTVMQAQLSAYGTLQGSLSAFQSAAQSLTNPATYTALSSSVADPTIFSSSVDSTASIGNHNIEVVQLAKAQKLQTAAFANNTDSIGSGTLTIDFGTYTGTNGTLTGTAYAAGADAGGTISLTVDGTTKTLTIPAAVYTATTLATAVNTQILTAFGSQVATTSGASGGLVITSASTGAGSSVSAAAGTLTVANVFGTATPANIAGLTSFTTNTARQTAVINISAGFSTIGDIANAINASNAGLSATVLYNGTSYFLQVSSNDGGTANSLRISVSDDDLNNFNAAGLSRLASDKSSGYSSGNVAYTTPGNVTVAAGSLNHQFQIALDGAAAVTVTLPDATYSDTTIVAALQTALDTAVGAGKTVVKLDASNQLVVSSATAGSLSEVTLSAETGNTGLATIFGTTTALTTPRQLTETVAPLDAILKIDGNTITKTSTSNIITDAIKGVTLNLLKTSATNVSTAVTISRNTSGISTLVNSMVTAYNSTSGILATLLAYDPKTGQAGALQGEATVRTIQSQMRATLQSVISGQTGLTTLSNIGATFQRDGTLKFDSTKLEAILGDQTKNVSRFFIGTNGDGSGIATKLNNLISAFLNTSTGTFTSRTKGLTQSITDYTKQKNSLEARLASVEARYRRQFSSLDSTVASMNTTQTYLSQQLSNLPGVVSNNKK